MWMALQIVIFNRERSLRKIARMHDAGSRGSTYYVTSRIVLSTLQAAGIAETFGHVGVKLREKRVCILRSRLALAFGKPDCIRLIRMNAHVHRCARSKW